LVLFGSVGRLLPHLLEVVLLFVNHSNLRLQDFNFNLRNLRLFNWLLLLLLLQFFILVFLIRLLINAEFAALAFGRDRHGLFLLVLRLLLNQQRNLTSLLFLHLNTGLLLSIASLNTGLTLSIALFRFSSSVLGWLLELINDLH